MIPRQTTLPSLRAHTSKLKRGAGVALIYCEVERLGKVGIVTVQLEGVFPSDRYALATCPAAASGFV